MEFTELSLAGGGQYGKSGSGGESGVPMKRKWNTETTTPSVDLQLKHPLPCDWEQCLDLQSGRMYYVNRKTGGKSWSRPEEQKLDLELNMSTGYSNDEESESTMVALPCSNCHLLVILSRSSPSCPNCKYVHSLESSSSPTPKPHPSLAPSNWTL